MLKRIETPETVPGGRILLTEQTRAELTAQQMEVVELGYPAKCSAFPDCERRHIAPFSAPVGRFPKQPHLHCHPMDVHFGDWVLIAPRSLAESPEAGLYFCHQDDVLAVFEP